jgi:hypothetical protein
MENSTEAVGKPRETAFPGITNKTLFILLAPCIIFAGWAAYALIEGNDYAGMPKEKIVVERQRKDAELRQIVAANIAKGDPIPRRETMLEELDVVQERARSWQELLVASGLTLRKTGIGVLLGIAAQFYVVFRLRTHYRKLQREGAVGSGV